MCSAYWSPEWLPNAFLVVTFEEQVFGSKRIFCAHPESKSSVVCLFCNSATLWEPTKKLWVSGCVGWGLNLPHMVRMPTCCHMRRTTRWYRARLEDHEPILRFLRIYLCVTQVDISCALCCRRFLDRNAFAIMTSCTTSGISRPAQWYEVCELCSLEEKTKWFERKDERFVIIECDQCDQPMSVWRKHEMIISDSDASDMETRLRAVADKFFKKEEYFVDKRQRTIDDHLHWHARYSSPYMRARLWDLSLI